ncbi:MAG: hypothetical protein ACI4AK_02900 [Lepagella sp.]
MKKATMFLMTLLAFLTSSCHDDVVDPYDNEKNVGWKKFDGMHFTSESNTFVWTRYLNDYYETYSEKYHIREGEYVEFKNMTDTCITIKYGCDYRTYFNLADVTDHKANQLIACPYSIFVHHPDCEAQLKFRYEPQSAACYFNGKYTDEYGCYISYDGHVYDYINISKYTGYNSPLPPLRKYRGDSSSHLLMSWSRSPFQYDATSLKCITSPAIAKWRSTGWQGELISAMPDLSDFLQLMLSAKILTPEDYEFMHRDPDNPVSILDVISSTFVSIYEREDALRDKNGYLTNVFRLNDIQYGGNLGENALILSKMDSQNLCCTIDAYQFFKNFYAQPKIQFYANLLRSLLSEEKCYFEMQYELIDCDFNDHTKEREFLMTLTDPQHSRNIMEYVILPLLIENREAIKDYIRQDAELSAHSETLCSAVDRLEEIYAATTDLTLGYRLVENQW